VAQDLVVEQILAVAQTKLQVLAKVPVDLVTVMDLAKVQDKV